MSQDPTQSSVGSSDLLLEKYHKLWKKKEAKFLSINKANKETETRTVDTHGLQNDPIRSFRSIEDVELDAHHGEEVHLLPMDTQILLHLRCYAGICNDSYDDNSKYNFITILRKVDSDLGIQRSPYEPVEFAANLQASEQMIGTHFCNGDQEREQRYKIMCSFERGKGKCKIKEANFEQAKEIEGVLVAHKDKASKLRKLKLRISASQRKLGIIS